MKSVFFGFICIVILGVSACTQKEESKTGTPSPAVAVVTPSPAATRVAAAGDLMKAKASLETALTEYKVKNYTAAVESVESAHKEVTAAAANAPAALRSGLETAGNGIVSAKGLIEKHDAGTEKALTGLISSVSKLAQTAKPLTSSESGAAAAAGSMVKGATEKTAPVSKPSGTKPAEKKK